MSSAPSDASGSGTFGRKRVSLLLERDCDALLIPSGRPAKLPKGMMVEITQALGGTYTVQTELGALARIDEKDADALGEPAKSLATSPRNRGDAEPAPSDSSIAERVYDVLRTCYDPEIPANIVDLGLVYACEIEPLEGQPSPPAHKVRVQMTLTAPGCGMGEILKKDIEKKLAALPGVSRAEVEVVFDPPWDSSRMSDDAKLALGLL